MHQAQSALETAFNLFDSGDYTKALEYVDKVVLVFSPACSKVAPTLNFCSLIFPRVIAIFINSTVLHLLQAKLLEVKLLLAAKDYSSAISETGYILKEDKNNLEALLLRGRAYYYLADHDVAQRFVSNFSNGLFIFF